MNSLFRLQTLLAVLSLIATVLLFATTVVPHLKLKRPTVLVISPRVKISILILFTMILFLSGWIYLKTPRPTIPGDTILTIRGRVVDERLGSPVSDAKVTVESTSDIPEIQQYVSPNGDFELRGHFRVGEALRIYVEKSGYEPASSYYTASEFPLMILLRKISGPFDEGHPKK